jgi:3'(2'), 5'-bisphosphate nucleotidase
MVVARSRSRHDAAVDDLCKRLGVTHSIVSGSVGLKAGLICEGLAHFYVHAGPETSLWDTCAPEAILTEAGGRMTDCDGVALRYDPRNVGNVRGVLASTGVIHDRIVEALADVRNS